MTDSVLSHFDDAKEFEECLNSADAATCSRQESKFVDETRAKYEEWGVRMFFSHKQAEWLKRIAGWED
jgi:hypothetical protein